MDRISPDVAAPGLSRVQRAASPGDRIRLDTAGLTREPVLERYRQGAVPRTTTRGASTGPDLSRLRGARTSPESVERGRSPDPTPGARLTRLADEDPVRARYLADQGEAVAKATSAAVRVAVGFGASITSGWSSGFCFWNPTPNWGCHGPLWGWWGSPYWVWGWSTCWSPCGGWGWNFGWYWKQACYWGPTWSYGWYSPWYGCPTPLYYTTVIYDHYDPPVVEEKVVYVEAPVEPAAGEAVVAVAAAPDVPAPPAGGVDRPLGTEARVAEHLALGDAAFREGRYSEAVHHYARAVELQPTRGVLHVVLSDALFATGDYHYAAYALRRALELDPALVAQMTEVDKRTFYGNSSDFDRQLGLLEGYLEDHFLDEDARLVLAANYLFSRRPAQAVTLLESPFSLEVRASPAGGLLLDRARQMRGAGSL